MVDKIDRPDSLSPYHIAPSAKTGDDAGKRQQYPEEPEEKTDPAIAMKWKALQESEKERRQTLRIGRDQIRHVWFRKCHLRHPFLILNADIELSDGTFFQDALLLSGSVDNIIHLRGFKPGQEVPITAITHQPIIEVSLRSERTSQDTVAAVPHLKPASVRKKINWKLLFLYSTIVVAILVYITLLVRK